jgi:hypothetical protein
MIMLTATYSIIALKVEQRKARWTFSSIQRHILYGIRHLRAAGGVDLEALLNRLAQFEQYCHRRKVEVFVIPALRKLTREADALLDELEELSKTSVDLLCSVREKLQQWLRSGATLVDDICVSLEQCCASFYRRLVREEELVALAERVIPPEEWFGIAKCFLYEDGRALRLKEPVHDEEEE